MPIRISETRGQVADASRLERRYIIDGSSSMVSVRAALVDQLTTLGELTYNDMTFRDVRLTERGSTVWEASALYDAAHFEEDDQSAISFDTTGGTRHVTVGLAEIRSSGAPDAKNLIGINGDGSVSGVDVPGKAFRFERKRIVPHSQMSAGYVASLYAATARVNNGSWDMFAKGEALFLGCRGQRTGYGPWDISYTFAAIPNPGTVTINGISLANVEGWFAQWVLNQPTTITFDGKSICIPTPKAIYATKVFEYLDFSIINAI